MENHVPNDECNMHATSCSKALDVMTVDMLHIIRKRSSLMHP